MRLSVADISDTSEPWIAGGRRYIDRCVGFEHMRISEVSPQALKDLPARSERRPVPGVIWYERRTYLIGDRRDFVAEARAQGQPITRLILSADREEPPISVLKRQGRCRCAYDVRSTDSAPVGPLDGAEQSPLWIDALANPERNHAGQINRGVRRRYA